MSSLFSWTSVPLRMMMSFAAVFGALAFGSLGAPVNAQSLQSIKPAATPLVLKERGSFFVGGETVEQNRSAGESTAPADTVTINQMYVEYMVPAGVAKVPVVLIHGAGLSGKSYDTTPDGRMGWFEYFVRRFHPTYVVDQVGRARSGFDLASLGSPPSGQPASGNVGQPFRFSDRIAWTLFRLGPREGEKFPDTKFPADAFGELSKQAIPDLTALVSIPNPTFKAIGDLASDLKGAVLISHSQSGHYPMEAVLLNPAGVRAIVALEPARCGNELFSDTQIARIAKVPTLVVFGDHLSAPLGTMTWQDRLEACKKFATRVRAAGGKIDLLETPSLGIRGNSHMLMQDVNNTQIADTVIAWIDANVEGGARVSKPRTGASRPVRQPRRKSVRWPR